MKLLQGKLIAESIYKELRPVVDELKNKNNPPTLAVILVGSNPVSEKYVNTKVKQMEEIGLSIEVQRLPEQVTTEQLISNITNLNHTANIHGILVQLPLPKTIEKEKIVWAIDPKKDVDGFQMRLFRPPAPQAIVDLLAYYKIPVLNKKITLVGYGALVGRPVAVLLQKQGVQVTICEKDTLDFADKIRQADIVISAVGKPGLITKDMVRPGQIIIDAGTTSEGSSTVGDVAFDEVSPIVEAITPVPGGVGPLTVAELFKNVVQAAKNQQPEDQPQPKEDSQNNSWLNPFIKRRDK